MVIYYMFFFHKIISKKLHAFSDLTVFIFPLNGRESPSWKDRILSSLSAFSTWMHRGTIRRGDNSSFGGGQTWI